MHSIKKILFVGEVAEVSQTECLNSTYRFVIWISEEDILTETANAKAYIVYYRVIFD